MTQSESEILLRVFNHAESSGGRIRFNHGCGYTISDVRRDGSEIIARTTNGATVHLPFASISDFSLVYPLTALDSAVIPPGHLYHDPVIVVGSRLHHDDLRGTFTVH